MPGTPLIGITLGVDFGAVKEVSTQVFNTQGQVVSTTFVIGTPGYMPAEQLRQNPMLWALAYLT